MKVKFKEVENISDFHFDKFPINSIQLYNPKYRDMPLPEVIDQSRIDIEYVPYGYNYFILVRSTGTIFGFRFTI